MRRALMGLRLWSATVLINSMIMTVYLWHLTLMILFIGLLYLLGGPGLGLEPGTLYWWFSRPLWIAILALLLVPVSLLLSPLERISRSPNATTASAPRQVTGAMMICLGVALLAQFGYGGGPFPGLAFAAFALVALGAGTCGLLAGFK